MFALIADEGRDCRNKEQMLFVIKYTDELSEIECFLAFIECEKGTSGAQLADLIEATCRDLGLDMIFCRGQGYDGAGNIAGICSGAAKVIQSKYPKSIYFHCASHKLNLCVVRLCKLTSVSNMMSTVTGIASFFQPKRQQALEVMVQELDNTLKTKLLPLCQTRWVERINAMIDFLDAVVSTLTDMALNTNRDWN